MFDSSMNRLCLLKHKDLILLIRYRFSLRSSMPNDIDPMAILSRGDDKEHLSLLTEKISVR